MANDTVIVEGGPLMDPASEAFQGMLEKSRTASEETLAITPDVSPGETGSEPPVAQDDTVETETPETLKAKLAGLQAELARVRKQKTGNEGEASTLREVVAEMQGQLKVLREGKTSQSLQDRVAELPDAQVLENAVAWSDELADARVTARLAERDRDDVALREAATRIEAARKMLKIYDVEKQLRSERKVDIQKAQGAKASALTGELDALFAQTKAAIPDLMDETSEIWKAGQAEYQASPHLMKQLGPVGQMVAVASAIAKNPQLVSKKVAANLLANIENAAGKAFQKGGAAPKMTVSKPVSINSQKDLSDFEAQVSAVKTG
jgi:hypothetical protein